MNFKSMNYTAYLPTGEILECDNFKTIFRSARYRVREDAQAAIIFNNHTGKIAAYLLDVFGLYQCLRPFEVHPHLLGFIKQIYITQDEGWMLKYAGLE